MPTNTQFWKWEEAFMKWGFGDGDEENHTETVAEFIRSKGYAVETASSIHNTTICSILDKDNEELLPGFDSSDDVYAIIQDLQKSRLPADLVAELNKKFPAPAKSPAGIPTEYARVLVPGFSYGDFANRDSEYAPWVITADSPDLLTNAALDNLHKRWLKEVDPDFSEDFGEFMAFIEFDGYYSVKHVETPGIWTPLE